MTDLKKEYTKQAKNNSCGSYFLVTFKVGASDSAQGVILPYFGILVGVEYSNPAMPDIHSSTPYLDFPQPA